MSAGLICCEVEHLHQGLNGSQSFSWSGQWHQTPSFNLGLSHCTDGIHDDGLFEDRFIAKRKYGCEVRAKINFTQVLSSCTLLVGVSPVCHLHHRPPPPWLLLVQYHFIVILKAFYWAWYTYRCRTAWHWHFLVLPTLWAWRLHWKDDD